MTTDHLVIAPFVLNPNAPPPDPSRPMFMFAHFIDPAWLVGLRVGEHPIVAADCEGVTTDMGDGRYLWLAWGYVGPWDISGTHEQFDEFFKKARS